MFKSLSTFVAIVCITSPIANAVEFVNQDGSKLSEICVKAAQAGKAYKGSNIQCNGMPITSFAKQFAVQPTQTITSFEKADNTAESELCFAAATSNSAYSETKSRLKINPKDVACNGVKLKSFAKRYNKQFNG